MKLEAFFMFERPPVPFYTLIFMIVACVTSEILDQQIPLSLSNQPQGRPSWSTLPVPNPTKSFWTDTPGANPLAREGSSGPLGFGDDDIDVCIIGSGITGISALYHLQRLFSAHGSSGVAKERKVVILEAREFCSGATGRNGGHLTRNPFNGYATRTKLFGKENANKAYLLEDYVSSSISDIIQSHGWTDDVDLVSGGHITVFEEEEEEERRAWVDYEDAKVGGLELDDVKFLDRRAMYEAYGLNHSGVFFSSYNLWPLKLVSNLYNVSISGPTVKVKLHTLTPVTSITPSSSSSADAKWTVATPRGTLTCKNIIHATNAYASYLLPQFQHRIIPTRGQMFAVRAKSSLDRLKHHSWQANRGYEYWFARPEDRKEDGEEDKPPLVLLGGGRDTAGPGLEQYTMDDGIINGRVSKTLKDFLPDLYSGTDFFEDGKEPEMEWTGIMGFTPHGVPIVGPVQDLEGQYIAAGFTGHGMPRAFAAAEVVAGMIVAKLTGTEWTAPEWLPEHYLTNWKHEIDTDKALCESCCNVLLDLIDE